jgi:protease secretion system membrane fusion protein
VQARKLSAAGVGWSALALGLAGFLLWAALAPLDEGVPAAATVTLDTKRKTVQHVTGGIVTRVLVREGERVTQGQVLIELDEALARASYQAVRQRYLGLLATQGRLLAEQAGASAISVPSDLQEAAKDPLIRGQLLTQEQLMASRRAVLRTELQGIEESMKGQQALLQSHAAVLDSRRAQRALLQEELANIRELVQEGYATRNRQRELERAVADTQAAIAELLGKSTLAERAVSELQQRALQRQQEQRKEVQTQLAELTRELYAEADKYQVVQADLARTAIRSPATGQVLGLAVQAAGSVVQAGQNLLDVVPEGERLLLEARIEPGLIDKVRKGLLTDVRFSAFSQTPQLVVEGEIQSVSRDALTDAKTGVSYYLARVAVTPRGMKALGSRTMQAGMPAEVIVKTGERSLLTYLLAPLVQRLAAAMKEQ